MKRPWLVILMPGLLAVMAAVFVVVLLVVKLMWGWTVPDLFPGAVRTGLVARSISWFTALKLALFLGLLAGAAGLRRSR
ncbi:MAG: hypothetical protein B1H04_02975 [Planctomycetales bacterium 4484_123]|nr:MAG: hypothetical protein B1H04_02975 [Planctomycetales bacterium 4484_123]